VASRTLTEVKWNATLLEGDIVDAVRKLGTAGRRHPQIGTGGSLSRTSRAPTDRQYLFWLFRSSPVA
jgi:hypothetical protein